MIAASFLSLVGFWLVRGAIERDRVTGVGQILAATPMTRSSYLLGRWAGHTAYLATLAALLALAAVGIAGLQAQPIDLFALWLPMLVLAVPTLAFVAGLAVAFEVLPLVRGGFGNIGWLFFWALLFLLSFRGGVLDFSGIWHARQSMKADLLASRGVDQAAFRVGGGPRRAERTFPWRGLAYDAPLLAQRGSWLLFGAVVALSVAPLFDRFDPTHGRRRGSRAGQPAALGAEERRLRLIPAPAPDVAVAAVAEAHYLQVTREARNLPPAPRGWAMHSLAVGLLRMALRGRGPIFWFGSLALVLAGVINAPGSAPPLALAFLWPVLVWSRLGAPDPAVTPLLMACPGGLSRPRLAAYLAGVMTTLPFVAGPALHAWSAADGGRLLAALATLLFPAALAIALGALTGAPKAFEAAYTALWYISIQTPGLDFTGTTATPNPLSFLAAVPVLLAIAAWFQPRD